MHFLLILGLLGGLLPGERHPLVPADAAIRTRWSGATSGTNGWIDRANVVCARTLCRRLIIKGVESVWVRKRHSSKRDYWMKWLGWLLILFTSYRMFILLFVDCCLWRICYLSRILAKKFVCDFGWNRERKSRFCAVVTSRAAGQTTVGHLSSCRLACFAVRKLRRRDPIGHLSLCEKACFAM